MNFWTEIILATFVIALLLTSFFVPQILHIAFRRKLFDAPDKRKIHSGVVPRLGGISFLPSILFAVSLTAGWCLLYHASETAIFFRAEVSIKALYLLCSLMLIYLVGIADDLIGLKYRSKFVSQTVCALFIILSGVYVNNLFGLLAIESVPIVIGVLLTLFVIIYITNAINLIDGIDGLASGISIIALVFYGVVFYILGSYLTSMIAWAMAGSMVAFFCFNVFGKSSKRTKIFMGDTGSLTVGIVLAFLSIDILTMAGGEASESVIFMDYNPIVLAISPLLVPIFDVFRVVIHRLKNHRNPFLPDRSHIHHKLLDVGMTPGMVTFTILAITILYLALNMTLTTVLNINWIAGIDIIIWVSGNLLLTAMIRRREKRMGTPLYR